MIRAYVHIGLKSEEENLVELEKHLGKLKNKKILYLVSKIFSLTKLHILLGIGWRLCFIPYFSMYLLNHFFLQNS